jgi:hypothetical protein
MSLADLDSIKVIGKGNGGIVQLVRHKWTGQFFALKVLLPENIPVVYAIYTPSWPFKNHLVRNIYYLPTKSWTWLKYDKDQLGFTNWNEMFQDQSGNPQSISKHEVTGL